jgi:ribonuclease Z
MPFAVAAEDGEIKLTFLGTGAPRPSHDRYGPAILVEAGDYKIMVDAGPGMRERLFQSGGFEMITTVDHLLITHLHFDHTISAPGLWLTGWLFGRKTPMNVYGPTGTAAMMANFVAAYDWDIRYRTTVGVHKEGSELNATDVEPGVFFDKDGLKITAFNVEHMPINIETGEPLGLEGATLGYRIDYQGRSVLFSGDTRSTPSSEIISMGKGVDVLIHETFAGSDTRQRQPFRTFHPGPSRLCLWPDAPAPRCLLTYHPTRDQLRRITRIDRLRRRHVSRRRPDDANHRR